MGPNSLDDLYESYIADIYRYLCSLCHDHHAAEDLTQETFYRAYLYLEDCKEEKIKPWLFRVAYNAFVDYKRKEKRSVSREEGYFSSLPHPETTEGILLRQERWEEAALALSRLPEGQRHALLLHDYHGLTYKEAADVMNVGLSQYKILVFRARQKLREAERRRNDHE
ncbi:sigma-70 family RNA polymerase sigma factor [Paenibacillus sp. MMS20-IR301]|uniref:sigma-70 family RNA polymerase sigma factor n=1 Tax=Paenibacillus sp. MMS20-IR301 TaxID=2895946 RepID=UPI0028EA05BA|nr:sigma-70 family RNA polymerase sigma factor [Paenibacillus sp. MMS20-IR301]WNS40970.1 sigma-70 family RNA polymerase sigma factor [Paenibacillus sp. MMS20-IR301]